MAEYINRDLADLLLKQRAEVYAKVKANYALTITQGDRAVIHPIAKADVRENVHGRWKGINNPSYSPFDGSPDIIKICSICETMYSKETNFCPYCGADMRGEENG